MTRHEAVWSLTDPEKAMKEWKRVLKPGGKLVIIDSGWGSNAPLGRRTWRFFSRILIMLTEFKNPWAGNKSRSAGVPEVRTPRRHGVYN
jgi:ubiquinone/menaquinone biosynthesis C-methylase UbiE